ncbi:hypothetical protein L2E82_05238 [Cichorium intybus]|uniref:Uncharacterized protein n=1 Tax=Cichorium intybus TaxID=13427 RepID=A0ACB9H6I6_CICIN|nr:hypothetical protein L2E82_05238 [Cichorium intybus]
MTCTPPSRCVKLSWLMVVRTPPLLDGGGLKDEDDADVAYDPIKQLQSCLTPRSLLHQFLKHIMVSELWFHSIWKPSKNHDHGPEKARIGVLVFEVASVMSKLVQSRTVHFFDESYDI